MDPATLGLGEPCNFTAAATLDGDLETRAGEMFGNVNGQDTRSFDVDVAPDDACEPYSVVLSADQADGSDNRDGQPKQCLPKGWITMIPAPDALHVWGGWEQAPEVLRPSDASLEPWVTSLDAELTRYDYVTTSYNAQSARENLGLSGMGVIYCHTFLDPFNTLAIAGSTSHDCIVPGSGQDNEQQHIYFSNNLPLLARCHLLVLAGCHTSQPDPDGILPYLPNEFARKGVDVLMGFTDTIYFGNMSSFVHYFAKLVHVGDPNPNAWHTPDILTDDPDIAGPQPYGKAAWWAAEYAAASWNGYGGVQSYDFYPTGLAAMARPAKWGGWHR